MKIVKTALTQLAAPFGSTDTSFTLTKFVDSLGNAVALSDFGTWFVAVFKSGDTTEMVKCSAILQNDDGSASITVASSGRNIAPTSPYAGSSDGFDFPAGADCIITNDPLTMSHFINDEDDHTLAGKIGFTQVPSTSADPVDNNDLTRKSWVAALVLGTLTTIDVIIPGTAGATVAAGKLVYFDTATSTWKLADASGASTSENVLLGIAQGAATSGNAIPNGVLLQGIDANQTAMTGGLVQYATNTPGSISNTHGTKVVAVGVAKDATHLYFDPHFDQTLTQDQIDAMAGTSGTAPSGTNKFVDNADTTGTGLAVRKSVTDALSAKLKFGGDGSDGALTIASGTTTIDLGGAAVVVKQYTSISITGTGKLAFTNAHANGTIIVLKSQGNVDLTSSQTPMIDASGLGGAGGVAGASGASNGSAAVDANSFSAYASKGGNAGVGATPVGGTGGAVPTAVTPSVSLTTSPGYHLLKYGVLPFVGGGGGGGGAGNASNNATQGTGGRGGGGLIIECGGAWNFTTASGISVAGAVGTAPTNTTYGGSGGGGAGGFFLAFYTTLTASSGTVTVSGGNGGTNGTNGNAVSGGGGATPYTAGSNGLAGTGSGGTGASGFSLIAKNGDFS